MSSAIPAQSDAVLPPRATLFDLTGIDLSRVVLTREQIEVTNPHRGHMALLDSVRWMSEDKQKGVALWTVKATEFWVPGHFPGKPMLPGVLQVEAGAQLSVCLFNSRYAVPKMCAFTHILSCSFRTQVVPGDDLYILAEEIKSSARRFQSRVMGLVKDKVTFEAEIAGIAI